MKGRTHGGSHNTHQVHHMTQEDRDRIANEKFGKKYDELDTHEKRSVAGTFANIAKRMNQEEEGEGEQGEEGEQEQEGKRSK
ncbi:hypothetical protein PLESTF_001055100 [Pleodorina starrii]|nr:hypothetical protein PLESTF_001055100 [Pleodorina starrii]